MMVLEAVGAAADDDHDGFDHLELKSWDPVGHGLTYDILSGSQLDRLVPARTPSFLGSRFSVLGFIHFSRKASAVFIQRSDRLSETFITINLDSGSRPPRV